MYSRQIEQLARQRTRELSELASGPTFVHDTTCTGNRTSARNTTPRRGSGRHLRNQTGWALVSIGLRLAQSGSH